MSISTHKPVKSLRAARQPRRTRNGRGASVANINNYKGNEMVMFKQIVPPRVMTRLKYLVNRTLVNAGFGTASIQLNANGLFDVDPTLGSPSVAGFTELSQLYSRNRVYAVRSRCTFVNRESYPVIANIGFESVFITANTKTLNQFENVNNKTIILPASGRLSSTLEIRKTALDIVGDEQVYTDFGYCGTSVANPTSLFYASAAVDATYLATVFTANGVAVRWELEFDVEFYERKILTA